MSRFEPLLSIAKLKYNWCKYNWCKYLKKDHIFCKKMLLLCHFDNGESRKFMTIMTGLRAFAMIRNICFEGWYSVARIEHLSSNDCYKCDVILDTCTLHLYHNRAKFVRFSEYLVCWIRPRLNWYLRRIRNLGFVEWNLRPWIMNAMNWQTISISRQIPVLCDKRSVFQRWKNCLLFAFFF